MAPRSTGSVTLRFGLVQVPVKLYAATDEEASLGFNVLHAACGSRVQQVYVCPRCLPPTAGEGQGPTAVVVDRADTVRGIEVEKHRYVTFTAEELEALEEPASPVVEIAEFVALDQVDPLHYGKGSYLGPDAGAARAYALFGEALLRTRCAGLGRWAKGGSQRFVMVRSTASGRLVLQQLLRADQVRSAEELVAPEPVHVPELELAVALVEQKTAPAFRPDAYPDEARARTLERIQAKVAGGEIVAAPPPANETAQIIDLVEALKASLDLTERRPPKRAARAEPESSRKVPRRVPKKAAR